MYSRGWRGAPAKGVGRETGARVQIPLSPLKKMKWTDHFYSTDSFHFFVPKNHGPDRAWKNFFKKIKKSCWQRRDAVITYRSCRAWQTNADNGTKTCPAGFGKHFQSYMRTRQKCNPEYIPLYLRSATFCWWQRSLNRPRHRGEIEEIQRTLNCWRSFEWSSNFRTTQFSKRIKMESQVHFDLENFFRIKILNVSEET